MSKLDYYLQEVIGKETRRNIYKDNGELLLPISTIITYDDIMLLEENGVSISAVDVVEVGSDFSKYLKIINETVQQVEHVFVEIRETKTVPMNDLRESVLPMIHKASDSRHLLQLFVALQAKDDYTYRHNIAVGAISNLIGKWMKLDHQDLLELTTAALLHDVGKMLIPEHILNKAGKLTNEEFERMKNHTVYGYEILKETAGITLRQALVALQHHERMDGSGYPLRLQGNNIDLFSRIVSVADVFHAMSSNRVYQAESPFYRVLSEMNQDMFRGLDPEITMLFIERTMRALIGNTVKLTDGRLGTILLIHQHNPVQPLVRVEEEFIDLSKNPTLAIEQIIE